MKLSTIAAVSAAGLFLAATVLAAGPRSVAAAAVPGTACSVFPADNVWNTDISQLPVNANSATWLGSTGGNSGRLLHPDFGGPPYGIPYNVASNSDLHYNFNFQYWDESDPAVSTQQPQGPYPVPANPQIEGPTDSHMLVINKDTCKLYETFATNLGTNPYSAGSGAIFDLNSNVLRHDGWTSADAAGLPIFPGIVRLDEVQAGFIGHAIRFTVHNTNNAYLWPARHLAGINDPTLPPMGARFRLKAGFDMSSYGTEAKVVLTAFQHYGLIVADNGSDWYFQGTEDPGWNNAPYDQMIADLKRVPASAFEAVDESALMIDPNSAQAGTVPSAAAVPVAAPRDRSAQVTWAAPANGGQPITSFTITGTPSGLAVVGGGVTTGVVFGLVNGNSYTFTVTATNAVGSGSPSPASNSVVPNGRIAAQSSPAPVSSRPPVNQLNPPPSPGMRLPQVSSAAAAQPPNGAPASPPAVPWSALAPRFFVLRIGK
jgi:Fibronectin type III domain